MNTESTKDVDLTVATARGNNTQSNAPSTPPPKESKVDVEPFEHMSPGEIIANELSKGVMKPPPVSTSANKRKATNPSVTPSSDKPVKKQKKKKWSRK